MWAFFTGFVDFFLAIIGGWFGKQVWDLTKAAWRLYKAPPALKASFRLEMHIEMLKAATEMRRQAALSPRAIARIDRWRTNWQTEVYPKLEKMAAIPLPTPGKSRSD